MTRKEQEQAEHEPHERDRTESAHPSHHEHEHRPGEHGRDGGQQNVAGNAEHCHTRQCGDAHEREIDGAEHAHVDQIGNGQTGAASSPHLTPPRISFHVAHAFASSSRTATPRNAGLAPWRNRPHRGSERFTMY